MRVSRTANRTSSAVLIYVILLISMQIFMVTVAVEAFAVDNEGLAWAAAVVSVGVAAFALTFLRWLRP